jgi:superfamily II DNA/RNA helicase
MKHFETLLIITHPPILCLADFAYSALVQPITVNVGRAGAANLDVMQDVEFVKPEARVVYLLECLQKTAPPVLIFSEKKNDVDDIEEYLLLKGVEAVGVHGGKDQEERDMAIRAFKAGRKDVLVATDVASKGLDFPNVQHVINFDMPEDIDNYVHRIGASFNMIVMNSMLMICFRENWALRQNRGGHDLRQLDRPRVHLVGSQASAH